MLDLDAVTTAFIRTIVSLNPILVIFVGVLTYLDSSRLRKKGINISPSLATILVLVSSYIITGIFENSSLNRGISILDNLSPLIASVLSFILPVLIYLIFRFYISNRKSNEMPIPKSRSKWLVWIMILIIVIPLVGLIIGALAFSSMSTW